MKRLLSAWTVICMIFCLLPVPEVAAERLAGPVHLELPTQVNPLYAHVADSGEMEWPEAADCLILAETEYLPEEQAAAALRQ